MKQWTVRFITAGVVLFSLRGISLAEYDRTSGGAYAQTDGSFDESVSLKRFRKGNLEWDTQELIASGLTALHQEHLQILRELKELKAAVQKIEAKQ